MMPHPHALSSTALLLVALVCVMAVVTPLARSAGSDAVTGLVIGGMLAGLFGALIRRLRRW